MAQPDILDVAVLIILLLGTIAYITKGSYWAVAKDPYESKHETSNGVHKSGVTRDVVQKMEEMGKNCVIFFGSQTGTAEDYATRLAKEGKARFGLETMIADLEDYDYENLDAFPEENLAIFVLATYGEGEPTDNAVNFYQFMTGSPKDSLSLSKEPPLDNLNYVVFGLGNNTYEHYNSMVRNVNKALEELGANRIGPVGEGDDGAGTMEEDFLAWKDPMWSAVSQKMKLVEREAIYEPVFLLTEPETLSKNCAEVYLGEPNKSHLFGTTKNPHNAQNPYVAPITSSKELFNVPDRNCLHLEIDISESSLRYQTGDHVAIWPTNTGREVDRFLKITGLDHKKDTVIELKPVDPTVKVPLPTPSTYDTVLRYYMEINAPVSRQFIANLASFAPTEEAKSEMTKLGSDKNYFQHKITSRCLNIAQVLEDVSSGEKWTAVPFTALIEGMNKLQPRYYSISSSSLVDQKKLSVTAIVESKDIPGRSEALKGVATNYLLALKRRQNQDPDPDPHSLSYHITGPRSKYDGISLPIHIRHSNFKLPSDPSRPIVMIGPGTGVAPFRAFVQERAAQAENGENVGKSVLFYGCRKESEDYLYREEWEEYKAILGDNFKLITAFSRESTPRVYVQDRILEYAQEINELLISRSYLYVCGDAANMAKAVLSALVKVISEQRAIPEDKAEEVIKVMRASSHYQFPMSYQQTSNHTETAPFNHSTHIMYNNNTSTSRILRESQAQNSQFSQPTIATSQADASLNNLVSQFANMALPTTNVVPTASIGSGQLPVGGNQYFYNPTDNTYLVTPNVYQPQTLGTTQSSESNFGSYAAALPYFTPSAYHGCIPNLHLMPYTPNRASSGAYTDRTELLYKDVPGLENRRGSYSTNDSVPGTPHYGSLSQREQAKIAAIDRSPFGSTPSPQTMPIQNGDKHIAKPILYKTVSINFDLESLLHQHPAIPCAVPAVFTPRENMRTLDQSLSNPIPGNRNVYIRGLHPNTDDATLVAYANRFGKIETSKAIIDTSTGACKGFGFAKYFNIRDSELCIRGFYRLGYEVGFARESFNSRLKAEGDDGSTNLYVSNLPKNMTEAELGAIFMDYTVLSSRILRDSQNNSRGVGFARFESRDICEEIIKQFHGQAIGEEGLLLQVRYADTPAQKDLKRITTERRQFRTQEYNVGAYGTTTDVLTLPPRMISPIVPRATQIARHFPGSSVSNSWKHEQTLCSLDSSATFKNINCQVKMENSPGKPNSALETTPAISEDESVDDGATINNDPPAIEQSGPVKTSSGH